MMMFLLLVCIAIAYTGGMCVTGYVCGRLGHRDETAVWASLFWPLALPIGFAEWCYKKGAAHE